MFISNVWNASQSKSINKVKISVGDVDILKSLQKLTGLSTNTLRPKVIRRDKAVLEVVKNLYENL